MSRDVREVERFSPHDQVACAVRTFDGISRRHSYNVGEWHSAEDGSIRVPWLWDVDMILLFQTDNLDSVGTGGRREVPMGSRNGGELARIQAPWCIAIIDSCHRHFSSKYGAGNG